jgi:hypothetical protein
MTGERKCADQRHAGQREGQDLGKTGGTLFVDARPLDPLSPGLPSIASIHGHVPEFVEPNGLLIG